MVPKQWQRRLWAAYRPGQEVDKKASDLYYAVQTRCRICIAMAEGQDTRRLRAELLVDLIGSEAARAVPAEIRDAVSLAELDAELLSRTSPESRPTR